MKCIANKIQEHRSRNHRKYRQPCDFGVPFGGHLQYTFPPWRVLGQRVFRKLWGVLRWTYFGLPWGTPWSDVLGFLAELKNTFAPTIKHSII